MLKILLVEDLEQSRNAFKRFLRKENVAIEEAEDGVVALETIRSNNNFDIIFLDLKMPRLGGIEVLKRLKEEGNETPIIVCSGNDDLNQVVECMRLGAKDYIQKPYLPDLVINRLNVYKDEFNLRSENANLKKRLLEKTSSNVRLIGNSEPLKKLTMILDKLAYRNCTVLINGETGTGKEITGKYLHYNGDRRNSPFVVVDCAALTENVLESELFGYEKGAFTGATAYKKGLIEASEDGTLFFDEIGELPLKMQTSLLRLLQEKEYRPIGANSYKKFNARIIAATNRNLMNEVKEGNFREDLYYRLNVVNITSPSLKERLEDIPALCDFLITKNTNGTEYKLTDEALKRLLNKEWNGNIRELENTLRRGIALSEDLVINSSDLFEDTEETKVSASNNDIPIMRIDDYEAIAIKKALELTNGNKKQAAEMLGLATATFYRKVRDYEV
jgi:DNA-binding NtrC family response regulator